MRAVYTGNDALRSFRPHVLLLDLGLPDLPGEEVARQVRAQPGAESPRIIALSGYDEPTRAGTPFDQRLLKPVELPELLRLLATVQP